MIAAHSGEAEIPSIVRAPSAEQLARRVEVAAHRLEHAPARRSTLPRIVRVVAGSCARNSRQRSMPSSTGSGPKTALTISQPMLSARSARSCPRSAYESACLHASSALAERTHDVALDAAEQVPRLREAEVVAELLAGREHLLRVVAQQSSLLPLRMRSVQSPSSGARRPAAAELERVLERAPPSAT